MKKNLIESNIKNSPLKYFLVGSIIISLYFNTKMADPFNAPKMYLLIFFSSIFLPNLFGVSKNSGKIIRFTTIIVYFFLAALMWAYLNSPAKYTSLFGETQRQLGLITYLSFAIFFLLFLHFSNINSIVYLQFSTLFIGITVAVYGFMQYTGNDFVNWVNQYNPIIGTLGNPNYAAAFMALVCIINFGSMFDENINYGLKIIYGCISIALVVVIYLSDARQGLIALTAGIMTFLSILLYSKNKKLGLLSILASMIGLVYTIAGMLQIGPLSDILYKQSISLRGYYWRSGISMFLENIFTGVGIDYYGAYFRSTREGIFPLKHGYDLTSTNAHNVPIQYFATGGLFLGIAYITLIIWTFYCGINALKLSNGNERIKISMLISAWVTFQAQSLVSIDNIGLTVWGWIISGYIVGVYSELLISNNKMSSNKAKKKSIIGLKSLQQICSIGFSLVALVLIISISKSEFNVYKLRVVGTQSDQQSMQTASLLASKISSDKFAQPIYKLQTADFLINLGQVDLGLKLAKDITNNSPNYPTYQWALANILESNKYFTQAISVREDLRATDPQNINNYLQLTKLYIETKNFEKARVMAQYIKSLNPTSEQAKIASDAITKGEINN